MTTPGRQPSIYELINLKGKAAVVTGGAMGIGLAIARRLGEAGAAVVIGDTNADRGERAFQELTGLGCQAKFVLCDVSKEAEVQSLMDAAVSAFGGIDILVNNAAVFPLHKAVNMTGDDFLGVLSVNLTGPYLCSREASCRMIEQKRGGVIVNIASVAGMHPGDMRLSAYDASKGGLITLTKSLAVELAPHRIRVNAVCPGAILTERMQALVRRGLFGSMSDGLKAFTARTPMERMGAPDEVARVVLFLSSDLSAYMTGSIVVADGGSMVG